MASSRKRAGIKADRRALATAAQAAGCTKAVYTDRADARLALAEIIKERPELASMRVYPCDTCDAWHLTAKKVRGKLPPWDRDADWTRPPKVGETTD